MTLQSVEARTSPRRAGQDVRDAVRIGTLPRRRSVVDEGGDVTESLTRARQTTDEIWQLYKRTGSAELRNQLVLQYSPLVKYVVGRMRSELPSNLDSADLVSEGVLGLMDAIDKFEPDRGLQFQTYAVPRVRGAILDSIRASDWVPRSVRSRLRQIDRATERLSVLHGRTPTEEEIASELDLTVVELRKARSRPTGVSAVDDDLDNVSDLAPHLDELFEQDDTRGELMQAVSRLPERDQVIIALYFFEGFTVAEIGLILGVTESRVSQLRTRAMASLRTYLAEILLGA